MKLSCDGRYGERQVASNRKGMGNRVVTRRNRIVQKPFGGGSQSRPSRPQVALSRYAAIPARACRRHTIALAPARRLALLAALVVLAIAVAFALAGCKYSAGLTQHTEDPDLGTLDENAEPDYQSNPESDIVVDLALLTVADSEDVDTQVAKLPHYDPDALDNGPTPQQVTSTTPHDQEASEGEEAEEGDRSGQGTRQSKSNDGTDQSPGDEEDGNNEGPGDGLDDDEATDPDPSGTASNGGETPTVDPEDGTTKKTAKGTVVAAGEYATMAQMIGGKGAVVGADEAWIKDCRAKGLFTSDGDELEKVEVAFSGDGTAAGSCNVDYIVDTIKPAAVLWDSKANFPYLSDSDQATLEANKIEIQQVTHIGEQTTEDYEVKAAMTEVGAVLEGASGIGHENPTDWLNSYINYHDEVLKWCCNDVNKGYSYKVTEGTYSRLYQNIPLAGLDTSTTSRAITVYVDSMKNIASTAVLSQTASPSTGTITLVNNGKTVDCSNGVAMSAAASDSKYMLIDYYLQLAGVMNNAYDTDKPDSKGRSYIIMPGSTASFGSSNNYATRSSGTAMFYNAGDGTVYNNWHWIGDSHGDFEVVLAANSDVKDALVASAKKSNGLYHMGYAYTVAVVPTGVAGSWTEGHADSFLFAPWAFRIQGEENLDAVSKYAEDYYTTFLRCSSWNGTVVTDWNNSATAG